MSERMRDISRLYHAVLDRHPDERAAYLAAACPDEALRREVESLLAYAGAPGSFLSAPALGPPLDVTPPRRLASGQQLGSYRIRGLIGAGGMGDVYAAYDPRLDREVAIKVLPDMFADDPDRLRRFEQEARAAAALNHPNIIAIHDVGRADRMPYIVMERVRGETLASLIARDRPGLDRSLEIAAAVADALADAHAHGVVHRDLKPANIMVLPDGRIKVLDFGLARISAARSEKTTTLSPAAPAPPVTRAGQVLGTPGYMPPEQLLGEPGDARADIYALGVILYELVTGRRPFEGDDFVALALTVLTQPPPDPCTVDPALPSEIGALICRALAKDAAARPASAAALKVDLERLRQDLAPASTRLRRTPARSADRTARITRYVRWVAASAAVSVLVYAAAAFRAPTGPGAVGERPVIAVLPLANLTGDASKDHLAVGIAESLTTQLARLSSVTVVSHETMADTPTNRGDLMKASRDLGANLLVQGSVRAVGDRLHVNARLVRADGTVVWAGDAQTPTSDLFAAERFIADALIGALHVRIADAERRQLDRRPTTDPEALDAYWRGTAMLDRLTPGDVDRAIASLELAVREDPAFARAHAGLVRAFIRKYDETNDPRWMTQAAAAAARALEIDPGLTPARLALASVYYRTGKYDEAIATLREVLAVQSANDEAHRLLASALERLSRPDEALTALQMAVALRPEYWRNHDALGLFYFRANRLTEAIASFQRVSDLRPDDYQIYQRLGVAYQAAGDNVRARQNHERALALEPDATTYSNLAALHYAEGRYAEAAQAFEAAVKLRPNRPLYHRNLGDAYLKLGRAAAARAEYEQAVGLAQKALAVNPSDAQLMSQLAVYEAKLGRHADATARAEQAAAALPTSPDVLYRRAVVLALAGDRDAALRALSTAVANGYRAERASADDDLAILHDSAEFLQLTASGDGGRAAKE